MIRRAVLMTIVATLAISHASVGKSTQFRWLQYAPRTILVTPTGRAVGGTWQRWASTMQTPGMGMVMVDLARCPGWHGEAAACSTASEVWLNPAADQGSPNRAWVQRSTLRHELGHIFDARKLTDADRLAFMRLWRVSLHPGLTIMQNWMYDEDQIGGMFFGEYPPVEWFAEGYRLCASYKRWTSDAAENEQNDYAYADNGRFMGIDYDYPAAWSARYDSSNHPTPVAKRQWALRAQRATCALIRRVARLQHV